MKKPEEETEDERRLIAALRSEPEMGTPNCLTPEQIIALAERSAPESDTIPGMAHVALCARCRREYAETVELMQLAEEVSPQPARAESESAAGPVNSPAPAREDASSIAKKTARPRGFFWRKWLAPGFGFALGAAVTGIFFFLRGNMPDATPRASILAARQERDAQRTRADRIAQDNATLEREVTALKLQQGATAQLEQEASRLNARLKGQQTQIAALTESDLALRQMPLPMPDWMRARESGQVRGNSGAEEPSPQITLLAPVDTAVETRRPLLECRP